MMRHTLAACLAAGYLVLGCSDGADPQDPRDTLVVKMKVEVGDEHYEFVNCTGSYGSASAGPDGSGPTIQALSSQNDNHPPSCGQWPVDDPDLTLTVYFPDWTSSSVPIGVFDVSEPETVIVQLIAANSEDDYRYYRSDVPGAQGTVTTTQVDATLKRVDVAGVTLGVGRSSADVSFPDHASVPEATTYWGQ